MEIDAIDPIYRLREQGIVREFLQNHKGLLPLLLEAPAVIARVFDHVPPLVLEVRTDPEDASCSELFIYIQTGDPPKEAWAKLKRLIDEWLIHQARQSDGLLGVNLEFARA